MAISGQTIDEIAARFEVDVCSKNPVFVLVEGGINNRLMIDDQAGIDNVVEHYQDIIDLCTQYGLYAYVIDIGPSNYVDCTDTVMAAFDIINARIKALVENSVYCYVVSQPELGIRRASVSYPENFWGLKSKYDSDTIHYTSDAYQLIARMIYENRTKKSMSIRCTIS